MPVSFFIMEALLTFFVLSVLCIEPERPMSSNSSCVKEDEVTPSFQQEV